MSIENELKKDGITVIKQLDTLSTTLIAKYVAEKFVSSFPFSHFRYHDLFVKVSRLNMYIADMPEGMSEANYFYKNSSIYFRDGLSLDEMKEVSIHEFIHHFQEVKDKSGNLYRLGLCDFMGIKIRGMALNEAAVQLISSRILKNDFENVKYYNIEFSTQTPTYYPLLCNLVAQMGYLVGDSVLYDSTLYSNDSFKIAFIKSTSEDTFYKIQNNFDKILETEEKLIILSNKIQQHDLDNKELEKATRKVETYKKIIQHTFISTQNKIFKSYFDNKINALYSAQDIEDFRKKLYSYKDLLGTTEEYTYFNDYYISLMAKLDDIYEEIAGNVTESALIPYQRNFLQILFDKISKLFKRQKETESIYHLS